MVLLKSIGSDALGSSCALEYHCNLVNYDNENEYEIEDLGYESEEYTKDAHEDDENNHSNGYAKRGITRLCKFRREYGKPDAFDALNMISGKHRALFYEFFRRRWFVAYRFCRFYPGRRWVDEKRNKLGMKSRKKSQRHFAIGIMQQAVRNQMNWSSAHQIVIAFWLLKSSKVRTFSRLHPLKNELWRTLPLFDSFDLLPFYLPNEVTIRCVRKHPLNDNLTSVYSDGASTVANTLEAKEASNGQITAAASAALGNLNHSLSLCMQFVEEILETVELYSIKDALVGIPRVSGLSTEQRKSLTIVVEIVANPSIIFMDEPTTGPDARLAAIVMRAVKNIVDTGRMIVCTIHQPSIDIFESFNESIPGVVKIKDNYNPATWMLEVTSTSMESELGVDFAKMYSTSTLNE
ncbi:AAA+ ATPase domain-containing protein [Tanacetum coccineum]